MTALAVVLVAAIASQTSTLSGAMPSSIDGASRVVWIDARRDDATACRIDGSRWSCPQPSADGRGIVVVIGSSRVLIAAARGVEGAEADPKLWGRLIRVAAGGAATDLHDLTLTPSRPERSTVRSQLRRFRTVRDESVAILKLSDTAFWIQGGEPLDADAFLSLEGPEIGSVRVATRRLSEDAADTPFLVAAPLSTSLIGRVQNARGEDVESATVDLFQPLQLDAIARDRLGPDLPLIARGSTRSAADGSFAFERQSDAPFLVVASAADGRASTWVTRLGPPIALALTPPLRARGRVMRQRLPLPGARVHFIPAAEAWSSSVDPAAHLAEEATAGDDGTFVLALPEQHAGEIQVVAANGATARVSIGGLAASKSNELALGDIAIPDPRRVIVRLLEPLEGPPCDVLAAGPIGNLGMQVVRSSSAVNTYTLDLPESGQWVLSAECGGRARTVVPMLATIPPAPPDALVATIDVRFARH